MANSSDLNAARGIGYGMLIGAAVWAIIGIAVSIVIVLVR
jgi:hypothetical protein